MKSKEFLLYVFLLVLETTYGLAQKDSLRNAYFIDISQQPAAVALRYIALAMETETHKKADIWVIALPIQPMEKEYAQELARILASYRKEIWLLSPIKQPILQSLLERKQLQFSFYETTINQDGKTFLKNKNVQLTTESIFIPSMQEQLWAFLFNELVSGLLLLLVIVGLVYQIKLGSIILPTIISLIAAMLYFLPYYVYGFAADWELLVFAIGLALLALEITILPGFGVAGIGAVVCLMASLLLMQLPNKGFDFSTVPQQEIVHALTVLAIGLFSSLVFIAVLLPKMLKTKHFRKLTLQKTMTKEAGYTAPRLENNLIGLEGEATTDLRPVGKVRISQNIYQATSLSGFIEKNSKVEVIEQEGAKIKVKKVE
ncbi:MAG: NfeD family protein [Bacteroidia bacterium]|nr:NfeD family protein [Bacteroidia bacterium]